MTDSDFELLRIERDAGVVFATIDAPPINVMTPALFRELAKFSVHVADDDSVRVVVLRSDNPDFFIAHFDVTAILGYPTDGPAERPTEHVGFHAMCETYRTMPKATIVEIGGRVGGGGSELSMSCDMRFGALDRTVINQISALRVNQRGVRLHGAQAFIGDDGISAGNVERDGVAFFEKCHRVVNSFGVEFCRQLLDIGSDIVHE